MDTIAAQKLRKFWKFTSIGRRLNRSISNSNSLTETLRNFNGIIDPETLAFQRRRTVCSNTRWLTAAWEFIVSKLPSYRVISALLVSRGAGFRLSLSGTARFAILVFVPRYFPRCDLHPSQPPFFPERNHRATTRRRGNWTLRATSRSCHRKNITWDWKSIFESDTLFKTAGQPESTAAGKKRVRLPRQVSLVFLTDKPCPFFWIY